MPVDRNHPTSLTGAASRPAEPASGAAWPRWRHDALRARATCTVPSGLAPPPGPQERGISRGRHRGSLADDVDDALLRLLVDPGPERHGEVLPRDLLGVRSEEHTSELQSRP